MKYQILPATSNDAPAVSNCVKAAYQHYIERMGQQPGPMLDDYAEIVATHSVWVCKNEEQLIGLLVLIEKPDALLLDNVAVHPDFQGHGIGRKLVALAEAEAKKRGYAAIQLYTHEKMTENIAIYEKRGYVEFDRRHELGFDRIYMKKVLN